MRVGFQEELNQWEAAADNLASIYHAQSREDAMRASAQPPPFRSYQNKRYLGDPATMGVGLVVAQPKIREGAACHGGYSPHVAAHPWHYKGCGVRPVESRDLSCPAPP